MKWDEAFEQAKYLPVNHELEVCPQHPGHVLMRYSDGKDRCTSNQHLPDVRDDADRIGQKLRELETPA